MVLRRLRQAGFDALFAGGCVRDMLLSLKSTDYDIATNATPRQVKRLFGHVLLIGAKFGVAMVIHEKCKVEVTTFRSDLSYSDGRHPDSVRFSNPKEDALRRDFTINGIFYDPIADEVIDYVHGQEDISSGIVRTIGPAQRRFEEDYLRMIRAVRFAVRFDFKVAPPTAKAMRKYADRITSISGERIFDELQKMLERGSAADAMKLMHKFGLAETVLPELFTNSQWQRSIKRLDAVAKRKDMILSLSALLAELPRKKISAILRRWGAANDLRDSICWMASHLDDWSEAADISLAEFKKLLANENFERLRQLWRFEEKLKNNSGKCSIRIARRKNSIPQSKISPKPLINGADLKKLGVKEGPTMGRILKAIYDAQLNEEIATRPIALKEAKKMTD